MTGNKEGETFANKKEKRPAANAADSPFYRHTGTRSRLGVVVMSMRGSGSASATGPRKYGCCRHAWYPALAKILCRGLQGYVKQPVHFSPAGAKYFSVLWRTPQFQFFFKDIHMLTDQPSTLFKQLILRNLSIILITIIYKIFAYNM